jgi:hypothetical protein
METDKRVARPLSVTILLGIVLSFSAWNGLRLAQALRSWEILDEYGARNGPAYLATSGAAWLIAGLVLAWGLHRGVAWSRRMAFLAAAGYAAWVWFDRLIVQQSRSNGPFAVFATLLLLAFTALLLLNPDVRDHFAKRDA